MLSSCSTVQTRKSAIAPDTITAPIGVTDVEPEKVKETLARINERNRTVEDDPGWVKQSYSGLMIRKLTNVSEQEFAGFKDYLDGGSVYILVHPAYFTFFHHPEKLLDNTADAPQSAQNVVEKMLSLDPKNLSFSVMQAQERRTRDFLEFMSTEQKLVIIVVPKKYQNYTGYTYKRGRDEYMRYLNEVTNFSKSVLFVESRTPNRGYLIEEDTVRLMEFLLSIKAKKILIGGGYIGRCLEDFYALLIEDFGREGIFMVPEMSDISPREMNNSLAMELLNPDGSINVKTATENMERGYYNVQEIRPDLINLQ